MPEGVVKEFNAQRGFGTIEAENGEELPVHRSALVEDHARDLHSGDIVEYTVGRDKRGRRAALQVRVIGWEDSGDPDKPREWTF
jgi:CspA family cold shock protein